MTLYDSFKNQQNHNLDTLMGKVELNNTTVANITFSIVSAGIFKGNFNVSTAGDNYTLILALKPNGNENFIEFYKKPLSCKISSVVPSKSTV